MSLREREGPVRHLQDELKVAGERKMALCLAGRILSQDLISRDAFHSVTSRIWKIRGRWRLRYLTSQFCVRRFLGSIIGDVREVDNGPSGDCLCKFLRVRVAIKVDKPLQRFLRVVVLGDGEETVIPIQYETLPNFCFRCGFFGHTVRECPESEKNDQLGVLDMPYGAWLKDPTPAKLSLQRN
ncbi:hypothetical protein Ddye_016041 [Dipteronia dyeriana]|uniref:CCHC-type domain-containing protein n=1 Tax=Dipteronia dyeriana TaxID=168575 RepID=A0AAD9U6I4_9ROSI|nr:hypothetical protein Ddye_016041 [Dipteronia dyeriana]